MQSEQEKSAESSAGSMAESRGGGERHGMGSGTSSLREMKPDPLPRTSRDAGPYLKRQSRQLGQHAVLPLPYFQIHSSAEGSVAATALPSTWPALRQKTYW